MKCEATSNTIHDVLLSKEIPYKSFKEICGGEPKKVNLGYPDHLYNILHMDIDTHTLIHFPPRFPPHRWKLYGYESQFSYDWEILDKFFSIHNIEPNWLNCNETWGWFDEDLGGWTGCMGKVWGTEY